MRPSATFKNGACDYQHRSVICLSNEASLASPRQQAAHRTYLGIVPARRGSCSVACRSARANALNVASTMWCEFLPASYSTHLSRVSKDSWRSRPSLEARDASSMREWGRPRETAKGCRHKGPPAGAGGADLADVQRHAGGVDHGLKEVLHQLHAAGRQSAERPSRHRRGRQRAGSGPRESVAVGKV